MTEHIRINTMKKNKLKVRREHIRYIKSLRARGLECHEAINPNTFPLTYLGEEIEFRHVSSVRRTKGGRLRKDHPSESGWIHKKSSIFSPPKRPPKPPKKK